MIKNFLLLFALGWAGLSNSQEFVPKKESIEDSQKFKLDKGVKEIVNKRSLAGSKIKKNKLHTEDAQEETNYSGDLDSEVRYWEYSE